jgi:hypothetical protein
VRLTTLKRIRRFHEGLELLWESDEKRIRRKYRRIFGQEPDLDTPRTFNEKILWLNLNDRRPVKTVCADKFAVRDWVSERIGDQYLIPLVGVYEDASDIDLESLPGSFVIKATHGSGWNLIVQDKAELDWRAATRKLNGWLASSYYPYLREWQYRDIPPRLVVEELLLDDRGRIPSDFKLLCLTGAQTQTIIAEVDLDRHTNHCRNLYDLEWNRLPFDLNYPASDKHVPRPDRLDEMVEVARSLARGFPFARIDLYSTASGLRFGEMTFTPDGGGGRFEPPEWDRKMGDLIELPRKGRQPGPG